MGLRGLHGHGEQRVVPVSLAAIGRVDTTPQAGTEGVSVIAIWCDRDARTGELIDHDFVVVAGHSTP
jgi:hypothetical protein